MIVIYHSIVANYAVVADLRHVIGQDEHENPTGVIVNKVVLNNGIDRVLDLDAGDAIVSLTVSNDDVVRLTDVQRGVGDTGCDATLDSNARAANWIDAIESGLIDLQISKRNISRVLGGDSIGGVSQKVKVLDAKIAARRKNAVGEFAVAV